MANMNGRRVRARQTEAYASANKLSNPNIVYCSKKLISRLVAAISKRVIIQKRNAFSVPSQDVVAARLFDLG